MDDLVAGLRRIEAEGRRGADALAVLRRAAAGARPPSLAARVASRWAALLARLSE